MNTEEKHTSQQASEPSADNLNSVAEVGSSSEQSSTSDGNEGLSENFAENEMLRKQLDDSQQRYLRAQADFDNFRRRARTEKEEFLKYASLKIIEPLLPILDNFERALTSSKETKDIEALVKGLDMVYRQLEQIMEQEGVTVIEAVGQPFNPQFHEAIMQVQSDEYEEGTVVEEIVKGYKMKDKVIRPAMVRVSS